MGQHVGFWVIHNEGVHKNSARLNGGHVRFCRLPQPRVLHLDGQLAAVVPDGNVNLWQSRNWASLCAQYIWLHNAMHKMKQGQQCS